MKRQNILTGYLLIAAAIAFWVSWFLMPDPGTTDTAHILQIVKASRISVFFSVIIQIMSAVLYLVALLFIARTGSNSRTMAGLILFGIGVLGLCSDAFFHLLAYFMTDDSVTVQQDVVRVMEFMQTKGVAFLIPLLLPFFVGSILLAMGLNKQAIISKRAVFIFASGLIAGIAAAILMNTVAEYKGPAVTLTVLGVFAAGQTIIGLELSGARISKAVHIKMDT